MSISEQYASACFALPGMHWHDKKLIIFRPRTVATHGLCGPDSFQKYTITTEHIYIDYYEESRLQAWLVKYQLSSVTLIRCVRGGSDHRLIRFEYDSHVIHSPATLRSSDIYLGIIVTVPCRLQSRTTTQLVALPNLFPGVRWACTERLNQRLLDRTPNPRMIYTMLQGGTTQNVKVTASSFFLQQ